MIFYGMAIGYRRASTKPEVVSTDLQWVRAPSQDKAFAILDAYAANEFEVGYKITVIRAYPLKLLIWLLFGVE